MNPGNAVIFESNVSHDFVSLLDAMSVPIILLNKDIILHINRNAIETLGIEDNSQGILKLEELFNLKDRVNLMALNNFSKFVNNENTGEELKVKLNLEAGSPKQLTGNFKFVQFDKRFLILLELEIRTRRGDNTYSLSRVGYGLFENSTIPLCIVNDKLVIKRSNTAFKNLFSLMANNNFEKYLLNNLLPDKARAEFQEAFTFLQNKKAKKQYEFAVNLSSRGTNDLFLQVEIIKSEIKSGWIVSFIDQSNKIKLLKKLKSTDERVNNLKSIFVAQMSHEIRTPINAILSFANFIKDELKDNLTPDFEAGFEVINRGGERIIRTINLILDTAEVMTDTYEYLPKECNLLLDVFDEVFSKYKKMALSKDIHCEYSWETNELLVQGDQYMIHQILANLFDNAVKFTNEGNISARIFSNSSGKLVVEISDTGIGMSEEYINRVYEPFSQEDEGISRRYEGNGLGLSLAKSYCDINGINISVKSSKSKGTIVELIFNNTISSGVNLRRELTGKINDLQKIG
jgi:signal transduction histidine kinase